MPIKNKDGTVYRLSSPNPLMIPQDKWEKADVVLHNMDWDDHLMEDYTMQEPVDDQESHEPEVGFIEPPKKIETPVVPKLVARKGPDPRKILIFHCQPATIRKHQDELYGETRQTIQYGEKFKFEAVMVNRSDFGIQIWASVELSEGSVIYPSMYKSGDKAKEYAWYKVSGSKPHAGGFLIDTVLSNYQPDFSE